MTYNVGTVLVHHCACTPALELPGAPLGPLLSVRAERKGSRSHMALWKELLPPGSAPAGAVSAWLYTTLGLGT